MTQKLVSAEVPRRVLYRVEEAVVLWALAAASCTTHQIGQAANVTEGRDRLIPAVAIDAYVSLLTVKAQANSGGDAA
jgi:hypothetical protein